MNTTRRGFLQSSAAVAAIVATEQLSPGQTTMTPDATTKPEPPANWKTPDSTKKGDMLYRALGKTNEMVSVLGLGGFHYGTIKDDTAAIKLLHRAVDQGLTFMDNSWDYNNGRSEVLMGQAIKEGKLRDKVFVMTKFDGRTKAAAARQIDESLQRLQMDHVDLMQFHEVIRLEDPDRGFAEDGGMQALAAAQKAGKTRYVGFTGHKDPLVHLRMLEACQKNGMRMDTVQMPLNVMDAHFRSFMHQVLPVLLREQIGVLGMKSMGAGELLKAKVATAIECLHFTMTLPTSVVITGIDSEKILDQALQAVRTFKPLMQEQIQALLARTSQAAAEGKYELFKTKNTFDSTAAHPEWLG